jgi:hypothetical protein
MRQSIEGRAARKSRKPAGCDQLGVSPTQISAAPKGDNAAFNPTGSTTGMVF